MKPDPNAADKNEGIETDGFDKPQLNEQTTVVQVQQVRKKVVPQQQQEQQPVQLQPEPASFLCSKRRSTFSKNPVVTPVSGGNEQPQAKVEANAFKCRERERTSANRGRAV